MYLRGVMLLLWRVLTYDLHVLDSVDVLVCLRHDAADVGGGDGDEPHSDAGSDEEEQEDEEVLAAQHPTYDATTAGRHHLTPDMK